MGVKLEDFGRIVYVTGLNLTDAFLFSNMELTSNGFSHCQIRKNWPKWGQI